LAQTQGGAVFKLGTALVCLSAVTVTVVL
jgi:hypothetical protein